MGVTAIIDYGLCNLDSVARAVEECGGKPVVTSDSRALASASHLILPGVGAFPTAMERLRALRLEQPIRQQALEEGVPFLGICLGMQLMATRGFEGREELGLDLLPSKVVRLRPDNSERVPHIGWNEVRAVADCPLLAGVVRDSDFYFVHSYHLVCDDPSWVVARTPYADSFVSVVQRGRMFGTQFHPEKSQRPGFQLLRNFLAL